ncbi:MAG: preprotein translocase subunit YajC [Candidatus Rariloculaceae bacterium]
MDLFISTAWAQGGAQSDPFMSFLPLIIIFALFYFMLIRPQNKRQKEHREMVAALEKGQEVVTGGGVLGKVAEVSELWVTVVVANGVELKVQKSTITALMPKDTIKNA